MPSSRLNRSAHNELRYQKPNPFHILFRYQPCQQNPVKQSTPLPTPAQSETISSPLTAPSLPACVRSRDSPISPIFTSAMYRTSSALNSRASSSISGPTGMKEPSTRRSPTPFSTTWWQHWHQDSARSSPPFGSGEVSLPRSSLVTANNRRAFFCQSQQPSKIFPQLLLQAKHETLLATRFYPTSCLILPLDSLVPSRQLLPTAVDYTAAVAKQSTPTNG